MRGRCGLGQVGGAHDFLKHRILQEIMGTTDSGMQPLLGEQRSDGNK